MTALLVASAAVVVILSALLWRALQRRNVRHWLPAYVRRDWPGAVERRTVEPPAHLIFCIADHFEPALGNPGAAVERKRVEHWMQQYPVLARRFRDADGLPPRHTFFFPAEQYRPEHIERLAELVHDGFGEVEVHLHHDHDTSEGLRATLLSFVEQLGAHGLPGTDASTGSPRFAFVHGNWALDNSLPDGSWCGVNDELRVLNECGCYADFTFPSAPSPTQPRRINSIYYALDDPDAPRSHDDGVHVRVGGTKDGDLMLVQGPLGIRWPGGRFWVMPRLENADLNGASPPSPRRADVWVRTHVCVEGRPDWVFVKVHTHGCKEANWDALLGEPMVSLHRHLAERYNDARRWKLHYVTAREMYNIVKAAEQGLVGDPGQYRDLVVLPPRAAPAAQEPIENRGDRIER